MGTGVKIYGPLFIILLFIPKKIEEMGQFANELANLCYVSLYRLLILEYAVLYIFINLNWLDRKILLFFFFCKNNGRTLWFMFEFRTSYSTVFSYKPCSSNNHIRLLNLWSQIIVLIILVCQ